MDARCISEAAPPESAQLEWRTGAAGCLLPIAIGGIFLFAFWARNPAAVDLDEMHRGRWIVELAASIQQGGIGWGYAGLALCMGWFAAQLAWRFAERVAVTATSKGLRMHGMFGAFIPWREVTGIGLSPFKPAIEIRLARPRPGLFNPIPSARHRIAGVELDDGLGEAFVAKAERLRAAA